MASSVPREMAVSPPSPLEKAAEKLRLAQQHARAADTEYRLRREQSKAHWREREAEVRSQLARLHREEVLSSPGRSTRSSSTSSVRSSPRLHQDRANKLTWPAVKHSVAMPPALYDGSFPASPSLDPEQHFISQQHTLPGNQTHVRAAQADSDRVDSPREWMPHELQHEEEALETSHLHRSTDEPAMQPSATAPFRHLSALMSPLMTPLDRVSPVTSPLCTPRPPLSPSPSSGGSSAGRPTPRGRVLRSSALVSAYQEANHEVASRLVEDGVYDGFRAAAEHWKQEISADAEALQRKLVAEMEEQARLYEQSIAHHAAACTDALKPSEMSSPCIEPASGIPSTPTHTPTVEGELDAEAPRPPPGAQFLGVDGAPETMRPAAHPQVDTEGYPSSSVTASPLPKIPKEPPNRTGNQVSKSATAASALRVPRTQLHAQTSERSGQWGCASSRPAETGFLNRSSSQVEGAVSQLTPAAASITHCSADCAPRSREPLETAGLVLMVGGSTAMLAIIFRESLSGSVTHLRQAVQAGALALRENVAAGARNSIELAHSAQQWAQYAVPALTKSLLVTARLGLTPFLAFSRQFFASTGVLVTTAGGRLHAQFVRSGLDS